MSALTSKIHGRMRLLNGATFNNNADIVTEEGLLATLNGMPCIYTTIDGVEAWFPLAKGVDNKTYRHTQAAPSSMWTVQHDLGTEDVWFTIRDGDGDIVATTLGVNYDEVDPQNKLHFYFATPITGSVFIIGTNAFSSPILNTGEINLGNGVSINNNGITVNGQVILLTDLVGDQAALDAVIASQTTIQNDLSAEVTRAQTAEGALGDQIVAVQADLLALDNAALRDTDKAVSGGSLAEVNQRQNWSKSQIGEVVALAFASTITVDLALSNNFSLALTGNATLGYPTNITPGQSGIIAITQDATGGRLLSFNSIFKFAGGTAPTLSTASNAVDYLCYYVETATRIMVTVLKDVR